ncbi:hypothetical protein EON83_29855 [bacterium]|nr:MAG: hypothetical protein EON83_29855 [bacterium]
MVPRFSLPQWFDFKHPSKEALAELSILDGRLVEVEQALERLLPALGHLTPVGKSGGDKFDALLVRSLYCFAVVTYIRCFNSGKRLTLKISEIKGLTQNQLIFHERLRGIRNQHLAHAVSEEEAAHIYVIADAGTKCPIGFRVQNGVLASDGERDVKRMIALVKKVRKHVHMRSFQFGDEIAKAVFGPKAKWKKLSNWPP